MPYKMIPMQAAHHAKPEQPTMWSVKVLAALAVALYCVLLFVDLNNVFNVALIPLTSTQSLLDAKLRVFNATVPATVGYHVSGRPDIRSFAFDLGGTTCACRLEWSKTQYWQRLLYGHKYMTSHSTTAFLAALFFHRWQWILLWKLVNEAIEELALGVFGAWAWFGGIPFDLETRYDSLLLDCTLAPLAFGCLCLHAIYTLDIPDPFQDCLAYNWTSCKRLLLPFLWFYAVLQTNGLFGFNTLGMILNASAQIACLWLIHYLQQFSEITILRVPSHSLALISACLAVMWGCFTADVPNARDEVLKSLLAFSFTGFLITAYQYAYTDRRSVLSALAAAAYVTILVVFLQIDAIVPRPADAYYANWQWCGISTAASKTRSCPLISKT